MVIPGSVGRNVFDEVGKMRFSSLLQVPENEQTVRFERCCTSSLLVHDGTKRILPVPDSVVLDVTDISPILVVEVDSVSRKNGKIRTSAHRVMPHWLARETRIK